MLSAVMIDPFQKVTDKNFNDFGKFPRKTFDTVLRDTYGVGLFYAGFVCSNAGSGQLRVGSGRLYNNGVVYYNDTEGGEALDLLRIAPIANSLWVAIAVTGQVLETDIRPTTYLTDTQTRDTTARNKPQESRRWAQISPIVGIPGPDPTKPLGTSDSCIVAWVKVDNTGIVLIEANADALAPSTVDHRARLADIGQWRTSVGAQIDVLGSNIAAFSARLSGTASQTLVLSIARDIGILKDAVRVPQDYSSYQSEFYLNNDKSDTNNVDYLAEVQEGIRFPPASIKETQLQLLNPLNGDVFNYGGVLYPNYRRVTRLENLKEASRMIKVNGFTFDSYEVVQKTMVRERLRVGPWYGVCTNELYYTTNKEWNSLSNILTLSNGEHIEVHPDDAWAVQKAADDGWTVWPHELVRARQMWSDGYETTSYSDTFVTRSTATGGMCGQTFVAPQDGYLDAVVLPRGEVGPSGTMYGLLLEVPSTGQPDLTKVIGRCQMTREQLAPGGYPWDLRFEQPVFTQKGKRYAFVIYTAGDHQVWQTKDNKYPNGSFFYITDGAWAMGDPSYDLMFALLYAEFLTSRLEIQLQPLDLAGGIANLDILTTKLVPSGTSAVFYGQFNGVWKSLATYQPDDASPFIGLPPLVPLKIVLQGSPEIMPVFGIGARSRVRTFRPRSDYKHISSERTQPAGVPAKTVLLECRLEDWRGGGVHTHAARLRYGNGFNTFLSPSVVEDEIAPDDQSGRTIIRRYTFVFPSAQMSYKIEQSGTTANTLTTYHVASRFDVATTT